MNQTIKDIQEIIDNRDWWQAEHGKVMTELEKLKQEPKPIVAQRISELQSKVTFRDIQIEALKSARDEWKQSCVKTNAELEKTREDRDKWKHECEQATVRMAEALHDQHQLRSFAPPYRKQPAQPVMPMLSKAELHANTVLNSLLLRADLISANRLLAGHKDDIDLIIKRAKDIGARMAATI